MQLQLELVLVHKETVGKIFDLYLAFYKGQLAAFSLCVQETDPSRSL